MQHLCHFVGKVVITFFNTFAQYEIRKARQFTTGFAYHLFNRF